MPAQLLQLEAAPDLVDRVYRTLMDAISDGSLGPAERVTQEEIAQQLAVSRQPVLQALRLLKRDGFVQDAPGRGLQVTPLDAQWIRNVYQVRGALDALAGRQRAVADRIAQGAVHALHEIGRCFQLDQLGDHGPEVCIRNTVRSS